MSDVHSQLGPDLASLRNAELPPVVRLAWGLGEATNRGPKPKQSTGRIVAEAVRIADDVGLEKLSMAAVAKPLGLATTALYRYVDSKDTLIELMVDEAVGRPPLEEPAGDWTGAARAWARALMDAYIHHPWLSDVVITGMPRTPNSLAWIESLLESLEGAPLSDTERLSAALLLQGIVRNHAAMMRNIPAGADAGKDSIVPLLPALGAATYPRLIDSLKRGQSGVVDEFDFTVSTMIRGLAQRGD